MPEPNPVLRLADGLYAALQSAWKRVGLGSGSAPPQEVSEAGGRFAVLPRREGRWPEARMRLPDSAAYLYGVKSLFRRDAVWRSSAPFDEVADFVARAAHEALPEASERRSGSRLEVRQRAGGLCTVVRARAVGGGVIVSLRQEHVNTGPSPRP